MAAAGQDRSRPLGQLFLDRCASHDGRPFLVGPEQSRRYGEVAEEAFAVARCLAAQEGVVPGAHVALLLPNGPLFVPAFFGAVLADAVPVPLDPRLRPPEITQRLRHGGCACALVGPERDRPGAEAGVALPVNVAEVTVDPSWRRGPIPAPDRTVDDAATVLPTAGSTAAPKAVVLSHRAIDHDQRGWLERLALTSDDVLISTLALCHAFGLTGWLVAALSAGAAMAMPNDSLPAALGAFARRTQATVLLATGAYHTVLTRTAGCDATDFASLRFGVSGASPLPPAIHRDFRGRYARPLYESYGLTEAAPIVTANGPTAHRAGTVGRPLSGVQLHVEPSSAGHGELWVRGPTVMREYWDNPVATSACLTDDGWLKTGDLARVDGDGYVKLLGRIKELIIRGGEKIHPAEVEEVLLAHPEVAAAAVVGEPDPRYGEVAVAYVTAAAAGRIDAATLVAFCRERMAAFKVPRQVRVLDSMPRTPSGKADKRALRARRGPRQS